MRCTRRQPPALGERLSSHAPSGTGRWALLAPERHRTLRATIAWSYELLEPDEQRLTTELAVFRGGWSLEACEAVVGGDVLDALSALVDHSLVVSAGGRFTMLETVRAFAVERLRESGHRGARAGGCLGPRWLRARV